MAPSEYSAKLESECQMCMAMLTPDNRITTPLEFWKIHRTDFPTLSRAASRILRVPTGSADICGESLFEIWLHTRLQANESWKNTLKMLLRGRYKGLLEFTPVGKCPNTVQCIYILY